MKNNFLGICIIICALIIGGAITYNTYVSIQNDRYSINTNIGGNNAVAIIITDSI